MSGTTVLADSLPPHVRLIQLATAIWPSKSIYVAARLAIADQLVDGPQSVDELARRLNRPADQLAGLCFSLVSLGLFSVTRNGHYALTKLGRALVTGSPGSARAIVLLMARQRLPARAALEAARTEQEPPPMDNPVRSATALAGSLGVRARRRTG